MKIMRWNYHGLGNTRKVLVLSELIKDHQPRIVFLFETLGYSSRIDEIHSRLSFDGSFSFDCIGHSGGCVI